MTKSLLLSAIFIILACIIGKAQINPIFTINNNDETLRLEGNDNWINFSTNGLSNASLGFFNTNNNFFIGNNVIGPLTFYTASGGELILLPGGNVGIGEDQPQEKLVVTGAVTLGDTPNATPQNGTIRWSGTDFEGYNGGWQSLTGNNNGASGDIIHDIDGNAYLTVQIGAQTWMKENLRTSRYRDGTPIAKVFDDATWIASDGTGKYTWYNNDKEENEMPYGKLYNWFAAADSRGLCPSGWHIPSQSEVNQLATFLGGTSVAGGKMKVYDSVMWTAPNTGATNDSGFTSIPAGARFETGSFGRKGVDGFYWTSTESGISVLSFWTFRSSASLTIGILSGTDIQRRGHSIRCIQD